MEEVTINDDEMLGFIMRQVYEDESVLLSYRDIGLIMSAQMKFYESKGLIEKSDKD